MSYLVSMKTSVLCRECVFTEPLAKRRGRAPKSLPQTTIREKLNIRHAYERLAFLIAANFTYSEWLLTLTYDEAHKPPNTFAAQKRVKLFNRQLRESRKAFGRPYKYLYTTEGRHGDKRLHHHIILNHYPGETEVLRKLWPDGDINWEPVGKLGFVGLAKYLTKEPMQHGREYVGDRLWTPSRNLEKPRITVEKVPDNYRPVPPKEAFDVEPEAKENKFGSYYYVDYKLPWRNREKRKA